MKCPYVEPSYQKIWNEATAALIKWLDEPCNNTKHRLPDHDFGELEHDMVYNGPDRYGYFSHRKDCPQCWSELRGEK